MNVSREPRNTQFTDRSGWGRASLVLLMHVVAGALVAIILPDGLLSDHLVPFTTRLSTVISLVSANPLRVQIFMSWMIVLSVPALYAFSIFAPIRLRKDMDVERAKLGASICIMIFSVVAAPLVIYTVFFQMEPGYTNKLGRLAKIMASSDAGLFVGGEMLFLSLILLVWFSYIALPTAYLKLQNAKH